MSSPGQYKAGCVHETVGVVISCGRCSLQFMVHTKEESESDDDTLTSSCDVSLFCSTCSVVLCISWCMHYQLVCCQCSLVVQCRICGWVYLSHTCLRVIIMQISGSDGCGWMWISTLWHLLGKSKQLSFFITSAVMLSMLFLSMSHGKSDFLSSWGLVPASLSS